MDDKDHQYHDTIIPLPFWALLLIALVCWPAAVLAQPMFVTESDGVRIVLFDEPCQVKEVSNLPYRATWTEKGKVYEGCFAANPAFGVVVAYFKDDKSVATIPIDVFKKVVGI
jgi:hypothetical protein